MFANVLKKLWNLVFPEEFSLELTFPWNWAQLTKIEGVALVFYVVGSIAPVFLIVELVKYLATRIPRVIIRLDVNTMTVITTIISFLTGFGAAVWYVVHKLHEAHLSVREALSMNFKKLGGGFFGFLKSAGIALLGYGVIMASEPTLVAFSQRIFGSVTDPAAEFAKKLHGWQLAGFALLATFGAAFFEEVIFRGFFMNALRKTFREGWFRKILRTDSNADYAAMTVSALAFAGAHLTLTGSPVLAFMGFILAMVYMRSGSLYTSMMLHALNNATAMYQLYNVQMHGVAIGTMFLM